MSDDMSRNLNDFIVAQINRKLVNAIHIKISVAIKEKANDILDNLTKAVVGDAEKLVELHKKHTELMKMAYYLDDYSLEEISNVIGYYQLKTIIETEVNRENEKNNT